MIFIDCDNGDDDGNTNGDDDGNTNDVTNGDDAVIVPPKQR